MKTYFFTKIIKLHQSISSRFLQLLTAFNLFVTAQKYDYLLVLKRIACYSNIRSFGRYSKRRLVAQIFGYALFFDENNY